MIAQKYAAGASIFFSHTSKPTTTLKYSKGNGNITLNELRMVFYVNVTGQRRTL